MSDGRLVASFSFRERRNERLCVSRDGGRTWDVENSINVFDATFGYSDRSYPASVQIDEETIGTVLYETKDHPTGGTIYFVRTPISSLDGPKATTLYQGDPDADTAMIFWPAEKETNSVEMEYRFTGLFGDPPNCVGIVMSSEYSPDFAAFQYQMGTAADRRSLPVNHVKFLENVAAPEKPAKEQSAEGDSYNDGCVHVMGTHNEDGVWVLTLDGRKQLSCAAETFRPVGVFTRRASVAISRIELE